MAKKSFKDKAMWLQFRDEWLLSQELVCLYCGLELQSDAPEEPKKLGHYVFKRKKGIPRKRVATVDHVIPLSKGGDRWDTNNLVVACDECNQMKKDQLFEEWMENGGREFILKRRARWETTCLTSQS